MERRKGLYGILRRSSVYDAVQQLAGADQLRERLVREVVRPTSSMTVADLGAGTGGMRNHLNVGQYIAVEPNHEYVKTMHSRLGDDPRVKIIEGDANDLAKACPAGSVDRVLLFGVLHHLTDPEANNALRVASDILAPRGLLIAIDPCFHDGQSTLSRELVSRDRGASVRRDAEYARLASPYFSRVRLAVTTGQYRFPYSHACIIAESEARDT